MQCISGCCQEKKCVETKKCKEFRNTIYIIVAIVGVILDIIFTVYLLVNLCRIKSEFKEKARKKKESEDKKKNDNNNNDHNIKND